MKKYLFGLFAIVLAVGFSSFKTTTKLQHSKIIQMPYKFWYASDDGSTVSDILYSDENNPITKDDLPFHATIPCEEAPGTVCVRGSNTETSVDSDLPSSGTDSDIQRANR